MMPSSMIRPFMLLFLTAACGTPPGVVEPRLPQPGCLEVDGAASLDLDFDWTHERDMLGELHLGNRCAETVRFEVSSSELSVRNPVRPFDDSPELSFELPFDQIARVELSVPEGPSRVLREPLIVTELDEEVEWEIPVQVYVDVGYVWLPDARDAFVVEPGCGLEVYTRAVYDGDRPVEIMPQDLLTDHPSARLQAMDGAEMPWRPERAGEELPLVLHWSGEDPGEANVWVNGSGVSPWTLSLRKAAGIEARQREVFVNPGPRLRLGLAVDHAAGIQLDFDGFDAEPGYTFDEASNTVVLDEVPTQGDYRVVAYYDVACLVD